MGRSTTGAKEETRQRLLVAAGRGFCTRGFGGVGADGVAKDAGVTSGAFYAHFGSKAEIFRAALAKGLDELRDGLGIYRRKYGSGWEAARAYEATREIYDERLKAIAKELQAGLAGSPSGG